MSKKVLLIGPNFFGYLERIRERLKKKKIEADIAFDMYNLTKKDRIFRKIFKNYEKNKLEEYFKNILKKIIEQKYEFIFIIKGEKIPQTFFEEIKKYKIKIINYQWDDIQNCLNVKNNFKYYNTIYTYSLHDSKEYRLKFRPFFYEDDIKNIKNIKNIDYLFIGSYHSERLKKISRLKEEILKNSPKENIYIYIYIDLITLLKNVKNIPIPLYKYLRLKKMSYKTYKEKLALSRVVIDLPHFKQKGLTTRCFEAIPFQTKILTISRYIRDYDIYVKENIKIISLNQLSKRDILEIKEWKEDRYNKLPLEIIEKYSLDYWINEIFKEVLNENKN